jgi:hypothetical protein
MWKIPDRHDITEILLKVASNTITLTPQPGKISQLINVIWQVTIPPRYSIIYSDHEKLIGGHQYILYLIKKNM